MSYKTKHTLSDRLIVILESNWQEWHKVLSVYGRYDGMDAQEKFKAQWDDGKAAYDYLNSEGWLLKTDTMILEVFKDLGELEEDYQTEEYDGGLDQGFEE